jgi:anti-sigma B factor antagonist
VTNVSSEKIRWVDGDNRTAVFEASGDIDLHRSTEFQQSLLNLAGQKPQLIVLDLSGVGYMDSSGMASLVKLLARVRRDGIGLKLAGLSPRVRSVFEITRLDTVFDIYGTAEEALAS